MMCYVYVIIIKKDVVVCICVVFVGCFYIKYMVVFGG